MAAGKYNFKIEQGTTFKKIITWKDPVGNPMNLTGYTAALQAREDYGTPFPELELTTENGGIILDPAGRIEMVAPPSITRLIDQLELIYDLELTAPDGTVIRLLEGRIRVSQEVTK